MGLQISKKYKPLHSQKLNLKDVAKLYERLKCCVTEQCQIETIGLVKPDAQSDEDFISFKQSVPSAFGVTVTITAKDGSYIYGEDVSVFFSDSIPQDVISVYMTNKTAYKIFSNQDPINWFDFLLDFSKPPLMEAERIVSFPTPNNSHITIQGNRDAWVASVYQAVEGVLNQKERSRPILHRSFSYDLGLMMFAFPIGLYVCWKFQETGAYLGKIHPIISSAFYLYVFFLSIFAHRILFGYAKWAFPVMELKENRNNAIAHRAFWIVIVCGIAGNFCYDLIKALAAH